MTQAVLAAARQYPGQERQFFEFVQKNQQMQQQLRAPIFEDKVVDHIVALAKVTDKEISKGRSFRRPSRRWTRLIRNAAAPSPARRPDPVCGYNFFRTLFFSFPVSGIPH